MPAEDANGHCRTRSADGEWVQAGGGGSSLSQSHDGGGVTAVHRQSGGPPTASTPAVAGRGHRGVEVRPVGVDSVQPLWTRVPVFLTRQASAFLPEEWRPCSHKNVHTTVDSSGAHNCPDGLPRGAAELTTARPHLACSSRRQRGPQLPRRLAGISENRPA